MEDEEIRQVLLELRDAQCQAIALLTQAMCRQLDPKKLKSDLQGYISAAKLMPSTSRLAIDIAMYAMAAAEAESALQAKPPSEGPHPKRGR
jgi:hypothetical protein